MSFLSDLSDLAETFVDKAIDFKEAESGGFIKEANAAETTSGAPVAPIEQRSLGIEMQRVVTFVLIGGVVVGGIYFLTRK